MKLILLTLLFLSPPKDELVGNWISSSNDLIVQCYEKNNLYFAKIIWFDNQHPKINKFSENGLPKDKWLGYIVMSDFTQVDGRYQGTIFDIKNGETYDAIIKQRGDELTVTGYILIPLLGKDITFKRYVKSTLPKQN